MIVLFDHIMITVLNSSDLENLNVMYISLILRKMKIVIHWEYISLRC